MNTPESLFHHAHIKQHFSRAAPRYLAAARLQKTVESRLLEYADYANKAPQRILDLGSGPGRASAILKKRWPKAQLIAFDLALPMLQQVPKQTRFWRPIQRVCGHAMQLPFADHSFDFVFSNLCLQWLHPLPEALKEIHRVLKPGALLAFTTFGPDTLIELRHAYRQIDEVPPLSPFAAIQQVGAGLQASGFYNTVLERDTISMPYPNLRALMHELQAIGATDARQERKRGLMGKQRWHALNDAYPKTHEHILSSWEIITAMAFKPLHAVPPEEGTVAAVSIDQITRRIRS